MDRRDFLEKLGLGAAFVLTTACMQSCGGETVSAVDFTLDLTAASNTNLKTNGGYIITNNVVVARDIAGNYVAATNLCSHEDKRKVVYNKANNIYECNEHGAQFDLTGKPVNTVTNKALTIFKTTLTGTTLRVYS